MLFSTKSTKNSPADASPAPGVLTLETGAYSRVTVQRHAPFRLLRLGKQQAVCSRLWTPFTSKPAPFLALLVRRSLTAPASGRNSCCRLAILSYCVNSGAANLRIPFAAEKERARQRAPGTGVRKAKSFVTVQRGAAPAPAKTACGWFWVPFATKRYIFAFWCKKQVVLAPIHFRNKKQKGFGRMPKPPSFRPGSGARYFAVSVLNRSTSPRSTLPCMSASSATTGEMYSSVSVTAVLSPSPLMR